MKKLFLDIETAPNVCYTWGLFNQTIGINQIVKPGYTLCWAAKWEHEREIMFSSIRDGEREMAEKVYGLLDEADTIIHYNGKSFDMKKLNNEFLKLKIDPPSDYHQVDLLLTARNQFRLTSNKLDFVAQHLGIGAKLPHKGMELWTGCIDGDDKAWKIMERYNKQDVRLLPKLYKRLLPWIKDHPNHGLYTDMDRPACANCGSDRLQSRGFAYTKTQRYKRYQCMNCATWNRGRYTNLGRDAKPNILTQVK